MQSSRVDIAEAHLQDFLRRVHCEVLPLGVREHLEARRLKQSLPQSAWQAGLAGLLATNAEQWECIARIYKACFPLPQRPSEKEVSAVRTMTHKDLSAIRSSADLKPVLETASVLQDKAEGREVAVPFDVAPSALEQLAKESQEGTLPPIEESPGVLRRLQGGLDVLRSRVTQLLRILPTWVWPVSLLLLLATIGLLALRSWNSAVPTVVVVDIKEDPVPESVTLREAKQVPPPVPLPAPLPTGASGRSLSGAMLRPLIPPLRAASSVDSPAAPVLSVLPHARPPATLQLVENERLQTTWHRYSLTRDARFLRQVGLLVLLITLPFAVLGLMWWWLPSHLRSMLPLQREAQAAHALALRRIHADSSSHHDLRPVYQVPTVLPASQAVLEDCASLLGRVYRAEHGIELDVEATLSATVESGGHLQPLYAPRRVARELLVFIDHESGSHPLLEPFLRILKYWERIGISIVRMRFHRWPGSLFPERDMRPLSICEVARSHDAAVLLVFSRNLRPIQETAATVDWLQEATAWPVRIFLDADPRTFQQRSQTERCNIEVIERSGMPRFQFTKEGLISMARYFAAEGIGVIPPEDTALPSMETPAVALAVRRWATAAAMVPDPDWDQLDHFRRLLGIEAELPSTSCVFLLLAYLARESKQDIDCAHGWLSLPTGVEDRLIRGLRPDRLFSMRHGYKLDEDEACIRRALILQLPESSQPEDKNSLAWWFWCLRYGLHKAILEPQRMPEIYGRLLKSPVAPEAGELIEQELRRRPGAVPTLERWLGLSGNVLLSDLWRGGSSLWRRALLWGGALGLMALLISALGMIVESRVLGRPQRVSIPATYTLAVPKVRTLVGNAWRPTLVVLPTGEFVTGSVVDEPGRNLNEEAHRVLISRRFVVAATEVTEAQFAAVMGRKPEAERGNLPQTSVTWYQAWEYCRRLSLFEGLLPCTPPDPGRPQSKSGPWQCSGYRLPTETEWEYAARGGGYHAFAGSDDPAAVAWFAKNATDSLHPVGMRSPNAFGLYDLSGNAAEWVATRYFPSGNLTQNGIDPDQPAYTLGYVVRGGSFRDEEADVRVARRDAHDPQKASRFRGFRIARDAKETE